MSENIFSDDRWLYPPKFYRVSRFGNVLWLGEHQISPFEEIVIAAARSGDLSQEATELVEKLQEEIVTVFG